MGREILFKGKRVDNGEWVEGDLFNATKIVVTTKSNKGIYTEKGSDSFKHEYFEVRHETVCQFTGLLDKNGKRIFEGDIVDAWNQGSHLTNGIIRWGIGTCKFFIGNESNSIVWNLCGVGKNHTQEDLEIIGNIHD